MFSGGDSSGDGVNSRNQFNWQMTSQTSCNVNSGGSIDWASLAQQWIQMKDSGAGIPETPPPPVISHNYSIKSIKTTKFDEQGEADMEVEKDDEVQNIEFVQDSPPPPPPGRWIPVSLQQQDAAAYCPPQQNWGWPARVTLPPPILHVPITTGSLTPPIPKEILNATTNLPKQVTEASSMLHGKGHLDQLPMDAAKRKILPAWIREGLEKMEREKLKQLDRDKDSFSAGTAAAHEDDINNFKSMVKSSITEMEGDESSGNEEETNDTAEHRDDTDADSVLAPTAYVPTSVLPERIHNSGKTYEEKVADMMIGVRKTLTELLLEVTNEEILSIANEAIRKRRAKGLEAYADSDTENSASDNDTTNDEGKRSDDDYDSEEELKANIRIRQRAFLKTIEEIEDTIEATAVREDLLLKEHRREETKNEVTPSEPSTKIGRSPLQNKAIGFEKEIGEPLQPDKKSNSNGKKRKERTSRFSDNKDSRNRMTASFYQPQSMGSGNLPTQTMPGASAAAALPPLSTAAAGKYKPSAVSAASTNLPSSNDKRSSSSSANKSSKQSTSSSSTRHHRNNSNSSTSSSDSSSSSTSSSHSRRSKYSNSRHKRSSTERSKRSHRSRSHRSTSHRSSRRRDSSDSNDDDSYKKRSSRHHSHKSHSSSAYSRRHDRRRRSDSKSSRSRTRSRSRSRSTTYSSSRRNDRC